MAAGALLVLGASCDSPPPPAVDHVLVILVDTLRADALGAYGAPAGATPALDAFAAESAVFLQAHTQGSWTAPSVIALMTGRRIAEEGVHLPGDVPVLAEQFQQAGFATAAFICNDIVKQEAGFARGFDSMLQMAPYSENAPILEWLHAHAERKSFAYVHLNEAHDPYAEEQHAWPVLRVNPPALPAERRAYYERVYAEHGLEDFDGSLARIETELGGYADDVTYSDARIAELLGAVAESWPAERTAIVITSDHGEGLWTRVAMLSGKRGKTIESGAPQTLVTTLMPTHGNQVYRELSHVPLIIHGPGIEAARVAGPVESIDLFPTLLELADLPLPADLPGRSLVPSLHGADSPRGDAFTFTRFNASLIAADGWQLIRPTDLGECEEAVVMQLYNLNADPEARVNLAELHPERVERMQRIVIERLRAGLRGYSQELSGADRATLQGLGYMDSEIVEQVEARFEQLSTEELLALLVDAPECLSRLNAARALAAAERELSSEVRAKLAERRGLEGSLAVRSALDAALDRAR